MVTFTNDFENDFVGWTGQSGTPPAIVHTPHHNAHSMEFDQHSACNTYYDAAGDVVEAYMRVYVYVAAAPTADAAWYGSCLYFQSSGGAAWRGMGGIGSSDNGVSWKWGIQTHAWAVTLGSVITTGEWVCLEFGYKSGAVAGWYKLWVNGVLDVTVDFDSSALSAARRFFAGSFADSFEHAHLQLDCAVVDSAYIGPEAAGVTVKKGSSLNATMMQMLNSRMLYSACNPFKLKV